MKSYLYSLFVRLFLALTGFAVFLTSSLLYGPEGRGIIGYGTSLFAIIGIIASLNLGRAYVSTTKQNSDLKKYLLKHYLLIILLLSIVSTATGIFFWWFSTTAQNMLSVNQVMLFSLMAPYFVWAINGNAFFAAFLATKQQENIILIFRSALLLFLILVLLNGNWTLDGFIFVYVVILSSGVFAEMAYLSFRKIDRTTKQTNNFLAYMRRLFKESIYHHLDFISFNIYPLFATVLFAKYASRADVGRYNFALQITSLIFLFAATANIRITAYVSDVGYKVRTKQFKKLFWATMMISIFAVVALYYATVYAVNLKYLSQFEGVSTIFLICGFSVPGYIAYQFLSPIWIELNKQKQSAAVHGVNFLVCAIASPFVFSKFGITGAAWMFAFFHFGLLISQGILYAKYLHSPLPRAEVTNAN